MNKKIILSSLLLFSINSYATDTRGYNILPEGFNVIDSQYSEVTMKQKQKNGIEGQQKTTTMYLRNTYFFKLNENDNQLSAAYIYLPYSKQDLKINKPIKLARDEEGTGDVRVLFAKGIYNMPVLSLEDYKSYDQNGFHSACSLAITIPTGNYDKNTTINSGGNRYVYKPECAIYYIKDKLQVDLFIGNSIFGNNKEYNINKILKQKNLYNIENRISYNLSKDQWVSLDLIYNYGGETNINNVNQNDKQNTLNVGVTLSNKIAKTQSIKFILQKTVSNKNTYSPIMEKGIGLTYQLIY